jgi:hypothetical protein
MNHVDAVLADESTNDGALAELCNELVDKSQGSFRQAPRKIGTEKEEKFLDSEVGNKRDAVKILREQGRHFILRAGVNNHPAFNAAGTQEAKIMHGQDGLAAEARGGVFGNNADSQSRIS